MKGYLATFNIMKEWLAIVVLVIMGFQSLYTQDVVSDDTSTYKVIETNDINYQAASLFIPDNGINFYVEHHADDVHVHLPVAGGWGAVLPYLHSFNGGSYKWTSHYLNGIRMNNILIPGDGMYHFSTSGFHVSTDPFASSIELRSIQDTSGNLSISALGGNIGGRVGWADWFINNISGHNSAQQRAVTEITDRMHIPFQLKLNYRGAAAKDKSPMQFQFVGGERQHIDQDYLGRSRAYNEDYYQATVMGSLGKKLQYAAEWQWRSHAFSELQYDESETSERHSVNLSLFSKGDHHYGIHLNAVDLSYRDASFHRNIIDQDGEGLQPYNQDGTQLALTPFYIREGALRDKSRLKYKLEFHNSWIRHQPRTVEKSNALFYQSNDADYQSLYVMDWEMEEHNNWLLDNRASITYEDREGSVRIKAGGGLNFIGVTYDQASLLHLVPAVDVAIEGDLSDRWIIGMRTGITPRAYDVDQLRLLARGHLNGSAYYWIDLNENRIVENSERGGLLFTTGGKNRIKGDDLGPARTFYVDVPIQYQPSLKWKFKLIPQFRSHRNTWDVRFHPDMQLPVELNEFGDWVFGGGRQTIYEVIPYSTEWMRDTEGRLRSFPFDQPFYAGITFQFERASETFYLRGSATGHIIAGGATMGNGPLNNNINQPSDAMADLNLRYAYLGRIDSDRSYLANLLMGYKYSQEGRLSFQLRYRDGQSFGYYESHLHENAEGTQVTFTQPLPRGDDPFTRLMGRREDFLLNINLYWQHRFSLTTGSLEAGVQVFNLFDFATEASEFTYGVNGDFLRAPLELQVPRTLNFSLQYSW